MPVRWLSTGIALSECVPGGNAAAQRLNRHGMPKVFLGEQASPGMSLLFAFCCSQGVRRKWLVLERLYA